ncbi:DUF1343 domain-containing protein [Geobacter sp. FeAm09]|uniref:exo-beta-N-acetylmuramidase NamZ family protein n=1 Tax=Geobacter sp. FeAm09 TaxID=2597769 RepID=UPI0011EC33F4|nr:DUF1343 domain-containing protein [Geobacter sp. FeAm09]QEM69524.1 DUF1343 domain-containing protein [Geobacter sp. FeAm09]
MNLKIFARFFQNFGCRVAILCLPVALFFPPQVRAAGEPVVLPGIDVLEQRGFDLLQGKRVGLITNHTGRSRDGRSTIDIINRAPGCRLTALFSPEHGIRGEADDKVPSATDRATGLPVHSLYGATCRPTPEMLRGVDILVFDIQGIGTRFYTYIGTLSLAMRAARDAGIPFVVLDRPNPLGGERVEGAVPAQPLPERSSGCGALTSIHPIPTRHGMTMGELARLFNTEFGIGCRLTVVPMQGWRRAMYYDATGLPWVNPSPNMKSLTAAILYPGPGTLETADLSVGRGTDRSFLAYGAPWVDGAAVARNLAARTIPGIRFAPCSFVPTAAGHPYRGKHCSGVCVTALDRDRLDPPLAGLHLAQAFYETYPGKFKVYEGFGTEVGDREAWPLLRQKGVTPRDVVRRWDRELERFKVVRSGYLLY